MDSEIVLPRDFPAEQKLLAALLLLPRHERDSAVRDIRPVWFFDPWHRWLCERIIRGRGLGADRLIEAIQGDRHTYRGGGERTAAYLYRMLLEAAEAEQRGFPVHWPEFAKRLETVHTKRTRVLMLLEQLKEELESGDDENETSDGNEVCQFGAGGSRVYGRAA